MAFQPTLLGAEEPDELDHEGRRVEFEILGDEEKKRYDEGRGGCYGFRLQSEGGEPIYGHIRMSAGRKPKRCAYCKRAGTQLCDFPTGKGKTCDRPVCTTHATHVDGQDVDYCQEHREEAKR